MPKLKSATVYVEGVTLLCPYCRDCVAEPSSGSHLWSVPELRRGGTVVCVCGESVYVPTNARPRMPPK